MATSLADIRAKIKAQENATAAKKSPSDNGIYPHWNIEEDQTVTIRFLPDADPKNTFFWVERQVIKLPFSGVKGQPDSKPVIVQVPCIEMWEKNACPILAEVRPWYKQNDEALKELAGKYWKKRSYIYQGFVRNDPLNEATPENPIRRFVMSPQIHQIIKASLLDPELEENPTDYVRGLDFKVTKTMKGKYADYTTSNWARKESALTEEEQEAIEKFGLFNLSDFLPKKPTEAELKVQLEMFHASVDGEPFDVERWGSYYRPFGLEVKSDDSKKDDAVVADDDDAEEAPVQKAAPKAAPKKDGAEEAETTGSDRGKAILAAIRNRNKK